MPHIMNLYLDDSGTRYPNKMLGQLPAHGHDWFALGGFLINDRDEQVARDRIKAFKTKWNIHAPLHSHEIRGMTKNFVWLRGLEETERQEFLADLSEMLGSLPVIGIACVIDRPGYNARYEALFREQRWMLCKTAFAVIVERSLKFAKHQGLRLRVLPERCNKAEDRMLREYYRDLKETGMPFDQSNSGKYAPLTPADFSNGLYDLRFKAKTSVMAQVADLYLWPICMGGYDAANRSFAFLKDRNRLIECQLSEEDIAIVGSKYSCFENVERR